MRHLIPTTRDRRASGRACTTRSHPEGINGWCSPSRPPLRSSPAGRHDVNTSASWSLLQWSQRIIRLQTAADGAPLPKGGWSHVIRGRDVIHYVDNYGAMACLVKGDSRDPDIGRLAH